MRLVCDYLLLGTCRYRLAIAAGMLLWAALPLSGQLIGPDIRMLDLIPNRVLEIRSRCGDAASLDTVHMAVWGSRRVNQFGQIIPALILQGSRSEQRYLTSVDARPFARAHILPASDRFLLLWNDVRSDAPGVWGVYVGTDGTELSTQRLVVPDGEMTAEPVSYDTNGVTTLLIQQSRSGVEVIDLLYLDRSGALLAEPEQIRTGAIDRREVFRMRRGGQFVRVSGGTPVILTGNGLLYPHPIPDDRFSRPFVFDGPAAIVTTLPGSILVRYDSLHHDMPQWSIPAIPGYIIGRDSGGWYGVTFEQFRPPAQMIGIRETRQYADLQTLSPSHTSLDTVAWIGWTTSMTGVTGLHWEQSITIPVDGLIYLEAYIWGTYDPHGPVDEAVTGTSMRRYYDSRGPEERRDLRPEPTVVVWTTNDSSGITYTTPTDTSDHVMRFGSLTPSGVDPSTSQKPMLHIRGDGLLAGGLRDSNSLFGMYFRRSGISEPDPVPIVEHPQIRGDLYVRKWNASGFVDQSVRTRTYMVNDVKLTDTWVRQFVWKLDTTGWHLQELPEISASSWGSGQMPAHLPFLQYDPDLNEVVWMLAFQTIPVNVPATARPAAMVMFENVESATRRSFDSRTFSSRTQDIIPLDSMRILHVSPVNRIGPWGYGSGLKDGAPVVSIDPGMGLEFDTTIYQRLFGDRFLFASVSRSKNVLTLGVINLDGEFVGFHHLPISGESSIPFILQDPADSLIIILLPENEGAVAYLFGPELQEVRSANGAEIGSVRVSVTRERVRDLNGVVHRDTLFVAWADDRSGSPQAYMNGLALPKKRSWTRIYEAVPEEFEERNGPSLPIPNPAIPEFGPAILGISPNPAYTSATIRIASRYSYGVRMNIYNIHGEVVFQALIDVVPGIREYPLPNVLPASGQYHIELRVATYRESSVFYYLSP